jgi:hypothetical protein
MKKVRETVEWMFGGIVQLFSLGWQQEIQKVGQWPAAGLCRKWFDALLANCKCCLGGNNVSNYFDCSPPSLEEYLGMV